ncbi:SPOR domain-containing protein [Paenibacillus typhae]|uniref:SPOR domain-containing protein n=1 Tax=Paenibacillus typhae TaxID=1174501 RepID=UPI001C8D368B|nr:SPOR domain-containing protein [Paenibacillus typhae]MBY0014738.1 SPOR domain-containing protein [Paenibacillus typhae]
MNNGKMTFRFDTDNSRDKAGQAGRIKDLDSRRGYLGTARDYGTVKESGPVEGYGKVEGYGNVKSYEAAKDYDIVRDYHTPLHRADVSEEVRAGDTGLRAEPVPLLYGDREDLSRGTARSASSFFRPEPVTDLWERTPRLRTPEVIQEDGDGRSDRYSETYAEDEPGTFGDISYSGLSYGSGGSYQTRRPTHWWKFALSIAGALGTGLLLGYAALNFISGVNDGGNGSNPAAVQTADAGAAGQQADGGAASPSAAGRIPVAVASQSYYLLQYGVFSTPAGAEQAQQELLAAGLAAGADPEGGNRVYAGVSPDREQAKLLSSGLKHQGIELYVREVKLPALEQAAFTGEGAAVDNYFAASTELLNELSSLSASLLSGASGLPDAAAVSNLHMQWTEAVKALEPGLSAQGQSQCASLQKAMSQGIAALNEYNKNQAQGLLWEVQESMLSFLTGQKALLSLLA